LLDGNPVAWGNFAVSVSVHAVAGCASGAATGGGCGPGALSAAFSKAATAVTASYLDSKNLGDVTIGVAIHAVVGGTAAELGGGKFANGAQTGAFSYLFNEIGTLSQRGYASSSAARGASILYGAAEGSALYDRTVFVLDADGLVVATYRGSIDFDPGRANCANGCPTIADGIHAFSAEPRHKYGSIVLVLGDNGTVPTAGPNPNQGGRSIATGVYIHTGYLNTTGAEGCLTINPAQWRSFISHFPRGTRGTVTILR
jgi:hypothetical protein